MEHHPAAGRPRQSYLRRAVSTAYYALFHYLCTATAGCLLANRATEEQLHLVRSIDHATLRQVCEWIANPSSAPVHIRGMVGSLATKPGVLNVALAFPDLMQARHQADYDHVNGFSKPVAVQHIDAAEAAIQGMKYQRRATKEAFFTLVVMQVKRVH